MKTVVVDHDATQKHQQEEVPAISECRALFVIAVNFRLLVIVVVLTLW